MGVHVLLVSESDHAANSLAVVIPAERWVAVAAIELSPASPASPFLQSGESPGHRTPRQPLLGSCIRVIL